MVVNEVVEQVAYADQIVLNKINWLLRKKLRHTNGMAQIKQAKIGSVDIDFVLKVERLMMRIRCSIECCHHAETEAIQNRTCIGEECHSNPSKTKTSKNSH